MKKLFFICALLISIGTSVTSRAFANNDNANHGECELESPAHFDKTVISGTVFDGNGHPIDGDKHVDEVTVVCNGKTRKADIEDDGTYSVFFPKSLCEAGDTVTVSAVTDEGSGSKSDTVVDDPDEGPCGSVDFAVMNISVPEFGVLGGAITGVGSIVGYLYLKAKSIV